MNPFEIFITSISWGTGSKSRPVLVLQKDHDTGTLLDLPLAVFSKKTPIGKLSAADKQRLLVFLSED